MRILLIFAVAVIPAVAQIPSVQVSNTTRPSSPDFKIGDRFEIVIIGAANQPVSVRTTMQGRMDWGPIIGWTDPSGRWSTTGQFEKDDFGDWREVWTVGGKLANPAVHISVRAPCLKEGQGMVLSAGTHMIVTCETAEGRRTFATPSDTEPFRTPDGRLIPGLTRSNMTAEQHHQETMQAMITGDLKPVSSRQHGDEAGALVMKIIGDNALSEDEMRNVLFVMRAEFANPNRILEAAKNPSETLRLLQHLTDSTSQEELRQQIAETISYVQNQ